MAINNITHVFYDDIITPHDKIDAAVADRCKHNEAQAKLSLFHRRQFLVRFLEWKCMNFGHDSTEVCSEGFS